MDSFSALLIHLFHNSFHYFLQPILFLNFMFWYFSCKFFQTRIFSLWIARLLSFIQEIVKHVVPDQMFYCNWSQIPYTSSTSGVRLYARRTPPSVMKKNQVLRWMFQQIAEDSAFFIIAIIAGHDCHHYRFICIRNAHTPQVSCGASCWSASVAANVVPIVSFMMSEMKRGNAGQNTKIWRLVLVATAPVQRQRNIAVFTIAQICLCL